MKNKKTFLKFGGIFAVIMCIFWLSFTSAITFKLNLEDGWIRALSPDNIRENMMYIHFADSYNDFGGFFYFSNGSWDYEEISADDDNLFKVRAANAIFECKTQVKWFYYNAERWERLWPLDDQTWSNVPAMESLITTWWLYASCAMQWYRNLLRQCEDQSYRDEEQLSYDQCIDKARESYKSDGFWYYGSLSQAYSWQDFNLTVWVDYNEDSNPFISMTGKLAPTFVRLNNLYPVWFVYDYNWWVWLAWCRFDSNKNMKKLIEDSRNDWVIDLSKVFEYDKNEGVIKHKRSSSSFHSWDINCDAISVADTLVRIVVEWIVWVNDDQAIFSSIGNASDDKIQYFATKSVSTSTLMNYATKKAELLCRWRWLTNSDAFDTSDKILCVDGVSIGANQAKEIRDRGWTLVVKNGDVTVKPMVTYNEDGNYDIYILGGNLIIDEEGAQKFVIGSWGFTTDEGPFAFRLSELRKIFRENKGRDITLDDINSIAECVLGRGICEPWWMDGNGDWTINVGDPTLWANNLLTESQWVAVASTIKWNFVVNWSVVWSGNSDNTLKNKYFIYGKFTTQDNTKSLESTFTWNCSAWVGSDGSYCPKFPGNPYRNAALVVIDNNYDSPLLKS